jgi:hypothetical protein
MATNFINGKKIQLFAAVVKTVAPYLEASKSYFAGDIEGKKNGSTYSMYIPDPGVATAGVDITSDDRTSNQKQVDVTLRNAKTGVDLTTLNRTVDIASFADEIAIPLGRTVGAFAQKETVERTILKADGAVVATSATFSVMGALAAKLRGIKAGGKLTGWFHPEDAAIIIAGGANQFQAPSEYAKASFGDASIGRFAAADWQEITEIPAYTMGTFTGNVTGCTVSVTVNTDGATTLTIANATLTSASTMKKGTFVNVAGVKTVDLNGVATQENYAVILTADAVCTAGIATCTINPVYFTKGAAKNVSTSALTAAAVITGSMVPGKTYRVIQVRDNDALAFDTYKFPSLPGAEELSESVGKFKIEGAAIGNVLTRDATYRFDMPYASEMVQPKLNRIALVQID